MPVFSFDYADTMKRWLRQLKSVQKRALRSLVLPYSVADMYVKPLTGLEVVYVRGLARKGGTRKALEGRGVRVVDVNARGERI